MYFIKKYLNLFILTIFVSIFGIILVQHLDDYDIIPALQAKQEEQLFLSGSDGSYYSGLITYSFNQDRLIIINSNEALYGKNVTVELYEINSDDLLYYMVNDEEGAIHDFDGSQHKLIGKIETSLNNKGARKVSLPIDKDNGVYYVKVSSDQTSKGTFLLVSDVGLFITKSDQNLIFWAQDLKSHKAIADAEVQVYSLQEEKKLVNSLQTSSIGVAEQPISSDPDVAIMKYNGRMALSVINYRYKRSAYYELFTPYKDKGEYFVYTDRPLYKPGDTVKFKGIIRTDHAAIYSIPSGQMKVEVYSSSSYDEPIYEKFLDINEYGTIDGELKLPDNAELGFYSLRLGHKDHNQLFYKTEDEIRTISATGFEVQHYRKPDYYIEVDSDQEQAYQGDIATFDVSGNYFSGQALSNQIISYRMEAYDTWNYRYYNPTVLQRNADNYYSYSWRSATKISSGKVTLNSAGQAQLNIPLKFPNKVTKPQIVVLEMTYRDASGETVKAAKSMFVYHSEIDVFQDQYMGWYAVNQKAEVPLKVYAYKSESAVDNVRLTGTIVFHKWEKKIVPGRKTPDYQKEDIEIKKFEITTDQDGKALIDFTPKQSGSYTVNVQGTDSKGNQFIKDFYVYVSKNVNQNDYVPNISNQLKIYLDKEEYKPGEKAKVKIESHLKNTDVFVILSREFAHRYQLVTVNNNQANFEIPIQETDRPNIYVKAGSFSENDFYLADKNLNVSTEEKRVNVMVSTDSPSYGPGENVQVKVKTTDSNGTPIRSEVGLYLVDKSIFELAADRTGNIFNNFWSERYSYLPYSHSLENIYLSTGAERGGCFTGETQILMKDGTTKNISDVKIGEEVLTFQSPDSNKLVSAQILGKHKVNVGSYLIINGNLRITPEHKVYSQGHFKPIGSLKPGDKLKTSQGKEILINSMEFIRDNKTVYNLHVAKQNTFIADNYYVHNQKGNSGGRTIFKDTAYWNPRILTNANGEAEVSFKLPDNLTTWSIAAIAVTKDTKVGQTKTEIVVNKDYVIRPILPNLIRDTDTIELAALLHNHTDQDEVFSARLEFDSGEVEDSTQNNLEIKAHDSKKVTWKVTPSKINDQAKVTFSSWLQRDEQTGDKISQILPVKQFGFNDVISLSAVNENEYKFDLNSKIDREKSNIKLSLSSTIVGSLPESMNYLIYYPYGCVEQTVSRFMPVIVAKENPNLYSNLERAELFDEIVNRSLTQLEELKITSGGWGWWYDEKFDPFVTAYAIENLMRARTLYEGSDIFNRITKLSHNSQWTYNLRTTSLNDYEDLETRAIMFYIDSLYQDNMVKDKPAVFSDYKKLDDDILALIVMAHYNIGDKTANEKSLEELISRVTIQGNEAFWKAGDKTRFGSNQASTALAMKAILQSGADRELAVKAARYLMTHKKAHYFANSYATAQSIDALTALAKTGNELTPNYSYKVYLEDELLKQDSVNSSDSEVATIDLKLSDYDHNLSKIKVEKKGEGQLYSNLLINQFITDPQMKAKSEGISITRRYVNEKGLGLDQIKVGDLVEVQLIVEGLEGDHNYAVIEDKLPAGLIPINYALDNVGFEEEDEHDSNYYFRANKETKLDGMVLSIRNVPSRRKIYTYKARAILKGDYTVPPAIISLMYNPEVNGHSQVDKIKVADDEKTYVIEDRTDSQVNVPKAAFSLLVKFLAVACLIIVISVIGDLLYFKLQNKHLFHKIFKKNQTDTDLSSSVAIDQRIENQETKEKENQMNDQNFQK